VTQSTASETAITNPDDISEKSTTKNWRTLLGLARPQWLLLLVSAIMAIITTVAYLQVPLFIEYTINALTYGTPISRYLWRFGIVGVIAVASTVGQWIFAGIAGENVVFAARTSLIRRYMLGRKSAVLKHTTGDLVSRATADVSMLQYAVESGFVSFVAAITGVIGAAVYMAVIDPVMFAITLGGVIVLAILSFLFQPKAGRERELAQESVGLMGGDISEAIDALAEGAEMDEERVQIATEHAKDARRHAISAYWAETLSFELGWAGILLLMVAMLAIGAGRVAEGHITIAALVAFVMYTELFAEPLMQIVEGYTALQNGLAASSRISEMESIPMDDASVLMDVPAAHATPL